MLFRERPALGSADIHTAEDCRGYMPAGEESLTEARRHGGKSGDPDFETLSLAQILKVGIFTQKKATLTELRRETSRILGPVIHASQSVVITEHGRNIAAIVPMIAPDRKRAIKMLAADFSSLIRGVAGRGGNRKSYRGPKALKVPALGILFGVGVLWSKKTPPGWRAA